MQYEESTTIQQLVETISAQLISYQLRLATAESCTGGLLSHIFTSISGSSAFFERGIISYSNQAKQELLHVSKDDLERYGAVSAQVAIAMAKGVRTNAQVDIGLSTTGIAGPTGGTKEKPVGLVYIALAADNQTLVKDYHFTGTRLDNKQSTVHHVLLLLNEYLSTI